MNSSSVPDNSRRDFLRAGASLAGVSLLGVGTMMAQSNGQSGKSQKPPEKDEKHEHRAEEHEEEEECEGNAARLQVGNGCHRRQHVLNSPRLSAQLGYYPSGFARQVCER